MAGLLARAKKRIATARGRAAKLRGTVTHRRKSAPTPSRAASEKIQYSTEAHKADGRTAQQKAALEELEADFREQIAERPLVPRDLKKEYFAQLGREYEARFADTIVKMATLRKELGLAARDYRGEVRRNWQRARRVKTNVQQGYFDRFGRFRPIRASEDYNEFTGGDFEQRERPIIHSLSQYVRKLGGLKAGRDGFYRGELERLTKKQINTPGIVTAEGLAGRQGKTIDDARQSANEAGYRNDAGRTFKTLSEFLEAVEADATGRKKYYSWEDMEAHPGLFETKYTRKRRNPDAATEQAAEDFEQFHGRPPKGQVEMEISDHAPKKGLSVLGALREIKLSNGSTWRPMRTNLLRDTRGRLWIGGPKYQPKISGLSAQEVVSVAQIIHVVYAAKKNHLGDKNSVEYIHTLGEETGERPLLAVDNQGYAIIHGGAYSIDERGIIN